MDFIVGIAVYFAATLALCWIAAKVGTSRFARIYTFFVALAGAYAVGFAIEMVLLQIDGYLISPQPWPVVAWSILGLTAFAVTGITMTSGLVKAIPCWVISVLLIAHGIIQHDYVPVYTGIVMIGFGLIILVAMPSIRLPDETSKRSSYTENIQDMSGVSRTARPASHIAQQIHLLWVKNSAIEFFKPEDMRIYLPHDKKSLFFSKIYLLCEASALRVILIERQNKSAYEELFKEFERLIFPAEPTPEAMRKLEAIKSAMLQLDEFFTEKRELSWCRGWLKEIGHDETNPETLVIFAQLIGSNVKSLRQYLEEMGPPAD